MAKESLILISALRSDPLPKSSIPASYVSYEIVMICLFVATTFII